MARTTSAAKRNRAENSGSGAMLTIVLCIALFLAARYFFGSGISSTPTIGSSGFSSSSGESFQQILPESLPAFRLSGYKLTSPDTASYVKEASDGTIYLMQFGYDKDVVQEIVTTVFTPSSGWDHSQASSFTANAEARISEMHASYGFIDGNTFVVGNYEYVAVQIYLKYMDKSGNIRIAEGRDLITLSSGNSDSISMYRTEQALRSDGYARK